MFLIAAQTEILINAPFGKIGLPQQVVEGNVTYIDHAPWKGYTTKQNKFYENEEVIDEVRIHNKQVEYPMWIVRNVQLGYVVIMRDGKYALCKKEKISYVD